MLELLTGANHFKGVLPQSIANLSTTLQMLSVNSNQLYGSIPPGLQGLLINLVNLSILSMIDSQFTGTIPEEIGKLQNLKAMGL